MSHWDSPSSLSVNGRRNRIPSYPRNGRATLGSLQCSCWSGFQTTGAIPHPALTRRQLGRFLGLTTVLVCLAIIRTTANAPKLNDMRDSKTERSLVLSRPNELADSNAKLTSRQQITSRFAASATTAPAAPAPQASMITAREIDPCQSKMLTAKLQVHVTPTTANSSSNISSDYDNSQVDEESRKELVRRGAVGRRCAVVALPVGVMAAIAEIAELKW